MDLQRLKRDALVLFALGLVPFAVLSLGFSAVESTTPIGEKKLLFRLVLFVFLTLAVLYVFLCIAFSIKYPWPKIRRARELAKMERENRLDSRSDPNQVPMLRRNNFTRDTLIMLALGLIPFAILGLGRSAVESATPVGKKKFLLSLVIVVFLTSAMLYLMVCSAFSKKYDWPKSRREDKIDKNENQRVLDEKTDENE